MRLLGKTTPQTSVYISLVVVVSVVPFVAGHPSLAVAAVVLLAALVADVVVDVTGGLVNPSTRIAAST